MNKLNNVPTSLFNVETEVDYSDDDKFNTAPAVL